MKRMLLALTLALLLSVAVVNGVASASHDPDDFQSAVDEMRAVDPTLDPPPNDGKHDFVVGGFQEPPSPRWAVSAHSGPLGEEPFGHASLTLPPGPPYGKQGRWQVTCVFVLGNLAQVGLVRTNAASNDYGELVVFFRDGGPGGGEGEDPAQLDGFTALGEDPNQCRNPALLSNAASAPPIEHGNILIHDAQP